MKKTLLEKYVKKEMRNFIRNDLLPDDNYTHTLDYHSTKARSSNSTKSLPSHTLDRKEKMEKIKSNLDLSFLDKCNMNKPVVSVGKRIAPREEGLVFNKINPIHSIDVNTRPSLLQWGANDHNSKLIERMAEAKERIPKGKIYI